MKNYFKFSVAMVFILTTLLSGCIVPVEGWGRGGDGGEHHGGDRGGDRHHDRGGDRGD